MKIREVMKVREVMKAYLKFIVGLLGFCFVFTAMASAPPQVLVDGPIPEDDDIISFLEEELLVENCSRTDENVVCYLSDNVSLPALLSSLDNLNLKERGGGIYPRPSGPVVLAVLPQLEKDRDGGEVYPPRSTHPIVITILPKDMKENYYIYPRPPLPPPILVIVPFDEDVEEQDLSSPHHPWKGVVLWRPNEEDAYPFRSYSEEEGGFEAIK